MLTDQKGNSGKSATSDGGEFEVVKFKSSGGGMLGKRISGGVISMKLGSSKVRYMFIMEHTCTCTLTVNKIVTVMHDCANCNMCRSPIQPSCAVC